MVKQRWAMRVRPRLDSLAERLAKPVIVSEIGYRTSSDCLTLPFVRHSAAPADPSCQAQGYVAALANVLPDPMVTGIFIWAWSLPPFAPNGQPGAQILHRFFGTLH